MLILLRFLYCVLVNITVCTALPPNYIVRTLEQLSESRLKYKANASTAPTFVSTKDYKVKDDKIAPRSGDAFVFALFPTGKKSLFFNAAGNQEWQLDENVQTPFVIYGENLNGSILSFTTHSHSCLLEQKDHQYQLVVHEYDYDQRMSERAFFTLKLPYYPSKLYVCLQTSAATIPSHQGDRAAVKLVIIRRTLPVWATVICLLLLLSLSGLFSGLNLGLMSLTPHDLLVIQEAGTPNDRRYAKKIYPVRKRGNFLLCTILLGNVLVNSTTTILLDTLISGILAVTGATLAIVMFGEIIPQAVCSRHGLKIGANTIILTRIFMFITAPIAFPLSKVLDCILGDEVGASYTRDQMSALLKHTQTTDIEEREKNIMTGVLSLKSKKIRDIMTNLIDVFMLEADRIVDDELVLITHRFGYSRIPVYEAERDNIIGLVNIRDFALLDTESRKFTVRSVMNFCKRRYGKAIMPDDSCYDVFNKLKKEQYHLGVVVEYINTCETDPKARAVGIVTLEDIIEEMIQEEIIDETDVFTDNRGKVRNMLSQMPDFSSFMQQTDPNSDSAKISAQLKVAIFQFLSTSVEPFSAQLISTPILARLLNLQLYQAFVYDAERAKNGKVTYIYEYGRPADYFVLILNGRLELITGVEKIVSEVGPFSYFGVSALCRPENKGEHTLSPTDTKPQPFIPDFSLRVSEDVEILRIRRAHWLASVRATVFEKKQKDHGDRSILNVNGENIDLLKQELENANNVDQPSESIPRIANGRQNALDNLTKSSTLGIGSEFIKDVQEYFMDRLRSRSNSHNVERTQPDSTIGPNKSGPISGNAACEYLPRIERT